MSKRSTRMGAISVAAQSWTRYSQQAYATQSRALQISRRLGGLVCGLRVLRSDLSSSKSKKTAGMIAATGSIWNTVKSAKKYSMAAL
jgi:hypothetical protein